MSAEGLFNSYTSNPFTPLTLPMDLYRFADRGNQVQPIDTGPSLGQVQAQQAAQRAAANAQAQALRAGMMMSAPKPYTPLPDQPMPQRVAPPTQLQAAQLAQAQSEAQRQTQDALRAQQNAAVAAQQAAMRMPTIPVPLPQPEIYNPYVPLAQRPDIAAQNAAVMNMRAGMTRLVRTPPPTVMSAPRAPAAPVNQALAWAPVRV